MLLRSALFALGFALVATSAQSHSKAVAHMPPDGATVSEVPEIVVTFDHPILVVSLVLTRDATAVEISRDAEMVPVSAVNAVPVAPLTPGDYRVEWRGMSADGHPMQGGFGFTVAE